MRIERGKCGWKGKPQGTPGCVVGRACVDMGAKQVSPTRAVVAPRISFLIIE